MAGKPAATVEAPIPFATSASSFRREMLRRLWGMTLPPGQVRYRIPGARLEGLRPVWVTLAAQSLARRREDRRTHAGQRGPHPRRSPTICRTRAASRPGGRRRRRKPSAFSSKGGSTCAWSTCASRESTASRSWSRPAAPPDGPLPGPDRLLRGRRTRAGGPARHGRGAGPAEAVPARDPGAGDRSCARRLTEFGTAWAPGWRSRAHTIRSRPRLRRRSRGASASSRSCCRPTTSRKPAS